MNINNNAFFDELILMFLYKKGQIHTDKIESLFGGLGDTQNVNNIISNRSNSTSYLNPDSSNHYICYDDNTKILKITSSGKKYIENRFSKKRS